MSGIKLLLLPIIFEAVEAEDLRIMHHHPMVMKLHRNPFDVLLAKTVKPVSKTGLVRAGQIKWGGNLRSLGVVLDELFGAAGESPKNDSYIDMDDLFSLVRDLAGPIPISMSATDCKLIPSGPRCPAVEALAQLQKSSPDALIPVALESLQINESYVNDLCETMDILQADSIAAGDRHVIHKLVGAECGAGLIVSEEGSGLLFLPRNSPEARRHRPNLSEAWRPVNREILAETSLRVSAESTCLDKEAWPRSTSQTLAAEVKREFLVG